MAHLWTWPDGGASDLIDALLDIPGVVRIHGSASADGSPTIASPPEISPMEISTARFLLAPIEIFLAPPALEPTLQGRAIGEGFAERLGAWLTTLGPDWNGQLILVGGPRPLAWPEPVTTLRPEDLTVDRSDKATRVSADFWQLLGQELDADELQLFREIAASAPASLDCWRQALVPTPTRLAALERLWRCWGLLTPALPTELGASQAPRLETPKGTSASSADEEPGPLVAAPPHLRLIEPRGIQSLAMRRAGFGLSSTSRAGRATREVGREGRGGTYWTLQLMGPSRIRRCTQAGAVDVSWRLRRAFVVVAYLALAPGHRATRDELAEAAWSEARPDSIQRNFHPTLSDARTALMGQKVGRGSPSRGQGILYQGGYYCLDPALEWRIDRDAFLNNFELALASRDSAEALKYLRAAWQLYRGELLEGFEGDWITAERERLYRRYLEVLSRIGALAAQQGEDMLALDAYRTLLLSEPFEEEAHLSAIEIYGRRGRRDLVRRQFLRLQEALKELGVEPSEEVLSRYHQLMR